MNEKLLTSIFGLGRLVRQRSQEKKILADFTYLEIEAMKFIFEHGESHMKMVADYLRIKPSSVTPVIDNLVKKGNIKRIQKPGDRRTVYLALTKKGKKALNDKCKHLHQNISKIFNVLNKEDEKKLIEILEKILKNHDETK